MTKNLPLAIHWLKLAARKSDAPKVSVQSLASSILKEAVSEGTYDLRVSGLDGQRSMDTGELLDCSNHANSKTNREALRRRVAHRPSRCCAGNVAAAKVIMNYTQVLARLDKHAAEFNFPVLDNAYIEFAGARLSTFLSRENWLLKSSRSSGSRIEKSSS